jgi:hypothetical protein
MLTPLQTRIVGNAIITRYNNGEGTVNQIIAANYPNMTQEDQGLVKAYIITKRPDIDVEA